MDVVCWQTPKNMAFRWQGSHHRGLKYQGISFGGREGGTTGNIRDSGQRTATFSHTRANTHTATHPRTSTISSPYLQVSNLGYGMHLASSFSPVPSSYILLPPWRFRDEMRLVGYSLHGLGSDPFLSPIQDYWAFFSLQGTPKRRD